MKMNNIEYQFELISGSNHVSSFKNNYGSIVVKMPKFLTESFKKFFPEAVYSQKAGAWQLADSYQSRLIQWATAINDSANERHSELASELSSSELASIASSVTRSTQFKLGKSLTSPEYLDKEPPEMDFVFGGLQAATVASLVGGGSTGKGFFCLSLLLDLVTGIDSLGLDIERKSERCAFITYEDNENALLNRQHPLLMGIESHPSLDSYKKFWSQWVHVESMVGKTHHLIDSEGVKNTRLIEQMINEFMGFRLVILDTCSLIHDGDLMSDADMKNFISALGDIARGTGAAVIFTHHVNKTSLTNGSHASTTASKGSAVLSDNVRYQINVSKMTDSEAEQYGINKEFMDDYVRYSVPKENYTKSKPNHWLKRHEGGILKAVDIEKE
jgi:RecA-family ATPase